jgi:hypothetical protein
MRHVGAQAACGGHAVGCNDEEEDEDDFHCECVLDVLSLYDRASLAL